MQFNPGNGQGVVDEIDDICGSNNITYSLDAKARRVNMALDDFYAIAQAYDKSWTFDDSHDFEDDGTERGLPIASCDLRAGQQDYPFARELLVVKGVFTKDNNGVFSELEEELDPQNAFLLPPGRGVPTKFRIVGNSILLDMVPEHDSDLGLKIHFGRTALKFNATDNDKELGIPVIFHEWICQVASLPFLIKNRLPNKNDIAALIQMKKDPRQMDSIPSFMVNRNQSRKARLGIKQESRW